MQLLSDFFCDASYVVQTRVEGKKQRCPIYSIWDGMRGRCANQSIKIRNPQYQGVECCDDWLAFSRFREWVLTQPWVGMSLDKDILLRGNKTYSPNACAFVPHRVNSLFTIRPPSTKGLPLGVRLSSNGPASRKPYEVMINRGGGKSVFVGNYETPQAAHSAYLVEKAGVILAVLDWWRSDELVKHSFQDRIAGAMVDRAEVLLSAARNSVQILAP